MDPSGAAGEQLVEHVDLDHVQGVAFGAGGAEDLVAWIRPARPASSWWSTSTSITSRGWPSAPAAPRTWCRGSVRPGRRAAGGARRPRSRPGDGHRRRRRRAPGAVDPPDGRGIKKEGASALFWFPSSVTRREPYRQSSMEHRAITSQARFQVLPDLQALSSVHAWQNDP